MSTSQMCVTVESTITSTSMVSLSAVVIGGWSGTLSTAVYCIVISFMTRDQVMINHASLKKVSVSTKPTD